MKRILLIIAGLVILLAACNAQYSTLKSKYNYKQYTYQLGDPYIPSTMSLASLAFPGLGQLIEGETTRGLGFLGTSLALTAIRWKIVFGRSDLSWTARDYIVNFTRFGRIGLRIWSAINANHIAKVNDLAFRDKYKTAVSFKILPFSGQLDNYGLLRTDPVGLTLLVSF